MSMRNFYYIERGVMLLGVGMKDINCLVLSGVLTSDVIYRKYVMNGALEQTALFAIKSSFDLGDRIVETTSNILVWGDALAVVQENAPTIGTKAILQGVIAYPNDRGELCVRVESKNQIAFETNSTSTNKAENNRESLFMSAEEFFSSVIRNEENKRKE